MGLLSIKQKQLETPITFTKNIVELAKAKALEILKFAESPSKMLLEWFEKDADPIASIEKVFFIPQSKTGKVAILNINIRDYFKQKFPILLHHQTSPDRDGHNNLEISYHRASNPIKLATLQVSPRVQVNRLLLVPTPIQMGGDTTSSVTQKKPNFVKMSDPKYRIQTLSQFSTNEDRADDFQLINSKRVHTEEGSNIMQPSIMHSKKSSSQFPVLTPRNINFPVIVTGKLTPNKTKFRVEKFSLNKMF